MNHKLLRSFFISQSDQILKIFFNHFTRIEVNKQKGLVIVVQVNEIERLVSKIKEINESEYFIPFEIRQILKTKISFKNANRSHVYALIKIVGELCDCQDYEEIQIDLNTRNRYDLKVQKASNGSA